MKIAMFELHRWTYKVLAIRNTKFYKNHIFSNKFIFTKGSLSIKSHSSEQKKTKLGAVIGDKMLYPKHFSCE